MTPQLWFMFGAAVGFITGVVALLGMCALMYSSRTE